MYIPEDFIERLLNSVNIVEVIQKRRQVERRGGAYMAKCPFHKGGEENNASMKSMRKRVPTIVLPVKRPEMQFLF